MQPYLLAALFALRAVALPQSADEQPSTELSGVVVEDGVELDSNFITEPFFEILSNYTEQLGNLSAPAEQKLAERQSPNDPATVTAEAAAKMKAPGGGKDGLFYRGDSRPPSVIFSSGFTPQGSDMSLRNHLSFAGNSGLVSLSRDPQTAQSYALGRSADKAQKGYIYVVAAKDVPNGYWVPGLYNPDKNPAVRRNQEFAVAGSVPAESISHAYEVTADKPSAKGQKIKNNAYSLTSSLSCFSKKRALCDPAKYTETTTSGRKTRAKVAKSFRVSGRAGAAVAFSVLSPYAHDVLDLLKSWDHPIGHAVNWFDNAMASLQESIGGPQVPEIYGNTLKLRFICWIRGEQRWKNAVDYACDRLRKANEPQPDNQSKRIKSVNDVLNACETLEQPSTALETEQLKDELVERCEEFREQAQAQDTAAA
ncbi:hypothetical protein LMH87_003043 [Akanthomyces muscarius]|uniref:Pierisin-like domain-containing protein n=1 Tax=Akanthomyces muscarius TaxID=2231603 RepID=A0A9W8Q8W6_AKAMU|nr:hypothetical protein LMH87_003043 [Akanthomyces muscarius]KAJ4148579.1 hypothetical protein LMH87_003043 [Akanthomyces muscarius]